MNAIAAPPLVGLAGLLDQIGGGKRVYAAGRAGSFAEQGFRSAWAQLCSGIDVERIARRKTAAAVAAVRLAAVDVATLHRVGLRSTEALAILRRAVDEVAEPLTGTQREWLDDGLGLLVAEQPAVGEVPPFVRALCVQPRAMPELRGQGRFVSAPVSHAEHSWAVAVGGALFAEPFRADPADAFLVGLAHHLHNALLPDAGLGGEALLGDALPMVRARCADEALAQLDPPLRDDIQHALLATRDAE
ncbi:MAG: hypothetical protein GEU81_09975, partial [Nitriliruptorales bacterium]|nr:hypothetical protein [Nitriliruptorales bacterium]